MFINKMKLLIIVLSFAVFAVACDDSNNNSNKTGIIKVNVEEVKVQEVPDLFEFSGNIEGLQRVKLSTKLMGTILYFPFEEGAEVKKGQVLVKINSADLLAKKQQVIAGILQAEAALKNMEINFNRVKSLYENESATKKEMEDIQMAFDISNAQVQAAREMKKEIEDVLSYSVIKAPFDGYIVNKFYEEGDLTAPGYPLLIVENFDKFKVRASVSASDIARFSKDDSVRIYIDELGDTEYTGKVIEINPGAHPASRQYNVQVLIDKGNKRDNIKSGMYAKLLLEKSTKKVIALEKKLLVSRGQLNGVYTVSGNNEVLLRWLRLGKEFGSKVEILSGLSEGSLVITNIEDVVEGQKVEVL